MDIQKLRELLDQTPEKEPVFLADIIRALGADSELVTDKTVGRIVREMLELGWAPVAFWPVKTIRFTTTKRAVG